MMRRFTKWIAGATAVVLSLTAAVPALAADNRETSVTTSVDPTYTVTIPTQVDFGVVSKDMETQEKDFVVSVEDAVMEHNAAITVTVSSPFTMLDADGAGENTLAYKLYNSPDSESALTDGAVFAVFKSGTAASGQTAIADGAAKVSGRVSMNPADILYAGKYSGTMTFTCEYAKGA